MSNLSGMDHFRFTLLDMVDLHMGHHVECVARTTWYLNIAGLMGCIDDSLGFVGGTHQTSGNPKRLERSAGVFVRLMQPYQPRKVNEPR